MSFFTTLDISSQALSAQRLRLEIISSNLANVNTTRTKEGGPYQRKDVLEQTSIYVINNYNVSLYGTCYAAMLKNP